MIVAGMLDLAGGNLPHRSLLALGLIAVVVCAVSVFADHSRAVR